jgi:hypothetical protein
MTLLVRMVAPDRGRATSGAHRRWRDRCAGWRLRPLVCWGGAITAGRLLAYTYTGCGA